MTIVIVLYKQVISQSKTYRSLINSLTCIRNGTELEVILYDNSPEKQDIPALELPNIKLTYIHDKRNIGIASAYNFALGVAQDNGSNWLMLLDHDTELTDDYFAELNVIDSLESDICAVVPKITCESIMISPFYSDSIRPLQGDKPQSGLQTKPIVAINSGAVIRISFLKEIGGFNSQFPLDYLDHWLFHEINSKGFKVWLMETHLEHELSVMDYSRVSLERYKSILDSEILFYSRYKTEWLSQYKKQLMKRLLKQILLVKNKKIAMYTLRKIVTFN